MVKEKQSKEFLIKLKQKTFNGDLYLAFNKFDAIATQIEYVESKSDIHIVDRRLVRVYTLEFEHETSKFLKIKKRVVKNRTLVGVIDVLNPEDRQVFLKDMLNIKKGFPFEDTKYYPEWYSKMYLESKITETISDLCK